MSDIKISWVGPRRLQFGNAEIGLSISNSPDVEKLFTKLNSYFIPMFEASERLVNYGSKRKFNEIDRTFLLNETDIIIEYQSLFLPQMNEIVFLYDKESQIKLKNLKTYKEYI